MDFTKSGMWKAVLAGGIVIALASYIYQIYTKDPSEEVRVRPVVRDFCLGAFVSASVYMFLPESIDSLIDSTANAVASATAVAAPVDIELQTGPARF
jgi:RsiW-degrading membrane proteinase PrsW (M82 family)